MTPRCSYLAVFTIKLERKKHIIVFHLLLVKALTLFCFLLGKTEAFNKANNTAVDLRKSLISKKMEAPESVPSHLFFFFSIPSVYEFVFLQQWFSNYGVCVYLW